MPLPRTFQVDAVLVRHPHEVHPTLGLGLLQAVLVLPRYLHAGLFFVYSGGAFLGGSMTYRMYVLSGVHILMHTFSSAGTVEPFASNWRLVTRDYVFVLEAGVLARYVCSISVLYGYT